MQRVYKDFLRRVLLVCLHYRELGYGVKNANSYVWDYWYKHSRSNYANADQLKKVKSLLTFLEDGTFVPDQQNIGQMIDQLTGQLTASEGNDRDLIDTIVRILGLPHARNTMSGATLSMLRSAILLPDELVTLKAHIKEAMSCMACGHKFSHGEMSVCSKAEGSDSNGFYCTRCQKPSFIASETDITKIIPVSSVKGLMTALKRQIADEKPADPSEAISAANVILGDAQAREDLTAQMRRYMGQARAARTTAESPNQLFNQNQAGVAYFNFTPEPEPMVWPTAPAQPAGGDDQ